MPRTHSFTSPTSTGLCRDVLALPTAPGLQRNSCQLREGFVWQLPGGAEDGDVSLVNIITERACTGSVLLPADRVEPLLMAAAQLSFVGIVTQCCKFLKANLLVADCIRDSPVIPAFPNCQKQLLPSCSITSRRSLRCLWSC